MSQINTLPIDVIQVADSKGNESSSNMRSKESNQDFSQLVERHISSEVSGNKKSSHSKKANETAVQTRDEVKNNNQSTSDKAEAVGVENKSADQVAKESTDASNTPEDSTVNNDESSHHENTDQAASDTETVNEEEVDVLQSEDLLSFLNASDKALQPDKMVIKEEADSIASEIDAIKQRIDKLVNDQGTANDKIKDPQANTASKDVLVHSGDKNKNADELITLVKQSAVKDSTNVDKSKSEIAVNEVNLDNLSEKTESSNKKQSSDEDTLTKNQLKGDIVKNESLKLTADNLQSKMSEFSKEIAAMQNDQPQKETVVKGQDEVKNSNKTSTLSLNQMSEAGKLNGLMENDRVNVSPLLIAESTSKASALQNNTELQSNIKSILTSKKTGANLDGSSGILSKLANPEHAQKNLAENIDADFAKLQESTPDEIFIQNANQNSIKEGGGKDLLKNITTDKSTVANPLFDSRSEVGISTAANQERQEQLLHLIENQITTEKAQSTKNINAISQEIIAINRKDFTNAVKDKVMLMINQKIQQVEIKLDPPELGNMHIRVNLQNEQAIVNFVVQNQQAKEALEQNLTKLKDMLAENGVDVGESNIEQQDQQADANASFEEGKSSNDNFFEEETLDANTSVIHAQLSKASARGVDYYA